MRRVDDQHVHVRGDQRGGAIQRVLADADGGADAQPAELVLARVRIVDQLLDVLDGDQALQPVVRIDDQQFFDLVPVKPLARLIERRADRHRDQVFLRHDLGDRPIDARFEAQVAVGQDADEPAFLVAVVGDRHAADAIALHQFERFVDLVGGRERDRIHDHPALRPLDAIDFRGLFLDAQVLVDDAHAALLGHRDGQAVLGHRVHRGAEDRHVQLDAAGESRADVDLAGQHARMARHEQDVVEGEGFGESRGDLRRRAKSFSHSHSHAVHLTLRGTSCTSCRCRSSTGSLRPIFGSSRFTGVIGRVVAARARRARGCRSRTDRPPACRTIRRRASSAADAARAVAPAPAPRRSR